MKSRIMLAALAIALSGSALAKLPPLTDEQKAEAEAKKAKAAEASARDNAALAAAQDKVAARWAQIRQDKQAAMPAQ